MATSTYLSNPVVTVNSVDLALELEQVSFFVKNEGPVSTDEKIVP